MIRRILVDHARKHRAAKRGSGRRPVELEQTCTAAQPEPEFDLVALDEALAELAALSARQARVVELRYFAGLSVDETAYALGVSERTVKQDWRVAKAWLRQRVRR